MTIEATTSERRAAVERSGFISKRRIWIALVRIAFVGGFFLLWEIASQRWIDAFLISSPSRILKSMIAGFSSGELIQHCWVTLQEIAIGFPAGVILGIGLGYAFGRSRLLAEVFEPIIIALNGIPRTALAPLFIVWLGIGIWSKVGVVFLLTFFLNFFNTYAGMRQLDQEYVDLARLMGARRWKLTFRVILPAISPYVFTGIRTSIPFAVIGAIVGEFVERRALRCVFLLTFFLNFFNTYAGMRQLDQEYVDLARLMGARGRRI